MVLAGASPRRCTRERELVRTMEQTVDDSIVPANESYDSIIDEDVTKFIPESLVSFVHEAQATLQNSRRRFMDDARLAESKSTLEADFDSPEYIADVVVDMKEAKLDIVKERLEEARNNENSENSDNLVSACSSQLLSPDVLKPIPPNPVAAMTNSQVKREATRYLSPSSEVSQPLDMPQHRSPQSLPSATGRLQDMKAMELGSHTSTSYAAHKTPEHSLLSTASSDLSHVTHLGDAYETDTSFTTSSLVDSSPMSLKTQKRRQDLSHSFVAGPGKSKFTIPSKDQSTFRTPALTSMKTCKSESRPFDLRTPLQAEASRSKLSVFKRLQKGTTSSNLKSRKTSRQNFPKEHGQTSGRNTGIRANQAKRRSPTLPCSPKFATTAKLGDPKTKQKTTAEVSLANSSNLLRIRQTGRSAIKGSSNVTIPRAPSFATTKRCGERNTIPRNRVVNTLAQSDELLKKGLRSSYGQAASSSIRRKVTIPIAPKFHTSSRRRIPQSMQKRPMNNASPPFKTSGRAPAKGAAPHKPGSSHDAKNSAEQETSSRQFRARTMPNIDSSRSSALTARRRITKPKPFNLSSGRTKPQSKVHSSEHRFHALPVPSTMYRSPFNSSVAARKRNRDLVPGDT